MSRVLIPALATAPTRPPGPLVAARGPSMGTTWSVLACGPDLTETIVQGAAQAALDGVVAQMSQWDPASDLSRFNDAPPGWRDLPPALLDVLGHGLDLADRTGGAFDPAAGRLVELWGFGPAGGGAVPTPRALADARAAGDWRALALDPARGGARQPGGLRLDLSGIAKGYGVDRVARALDGLGATAYLVEVGGELRGAGVKPNGQPWWVALETPPHLNAPETRLALLNHAVATSGNYVRYFDAAGRRYGHTLDPRTGWPIDNGLACVSVVQPTAMAADALATALLVLGPTDGPAFARAHDIAALFTFEGAGEMQRLSPAMAAMLD